MKTTMWEPLLTPDDYSDQKADTVETIIQKRTIEASRICFWEEGLCDSMLHEALFAYMCEQMVYKNPWISPENIAKLFTQAQSIPGIHTTDLAYLVTDITTMDPEITDEKLLTIMKKTHDLVRVIRNEYRNLLLKACSSSKTVLTILLGSNEFMYGHCLRAINIWDDAENNIIDSINQGIIKSVADYRET